MSVYKRPLRSDELWHSGKHKYIEKIGKRYFYSVEELEAFYKRLRKAEKKSNMLKEKSAEARSRGDVSSAKEYDRRQQGIENRIAEYIMSKRDPQRFVEDLEQYAEEYDNYDPHKVTYTHNATVKKGHRV